MNLIDESFEEKKPNNSKKLVKIIIIVMAILLVAIIGIIIAIGYMKSNTLKLYIDGRQNEKVKEMMIIEEDGTIYFPIKEVASYLGYKSYNGEYSNKSEDTSKCYVECSNEIANFSLNSNKIYKLLTSNKDLNYDYYYTSKPVKAMNGVLYTTSEGLELAFNVSFQYDANNKKVVIYTLPYLIQSYNTMALDNGYEKINNEFNNQKAILNDMLIVEKEKSNVFGVIDLKGNVIFESKYDNIEYIPNMGDFLVESDGKVGLMSAKRETKIQILYDDLKLIDSDLDLFLVEKDRKYGIMDSKGNIKLYIEYDEIGIDNTKFSQNDIKNRYVLVNNLIPVKKGKLWGLFDKNGNMIVDFEYDSFGYIASSNKDAINLLLIPDYNVIVACKNKKYTLINSSGKKLCAVVLDDVYMTIRSGKKYYYMNFNDKNLNVLEYLDSL